MIRLLSLTSVIRDFVYPNRCGFCGRIIEPSKLVCCDCANKISFLPFGAEAWSNSWHNSDLDGFFVSCEYSGTVRNGLLRLKRSYGFNAAEYICLELADRIEASGLSGQIDLVTCVPMSRSRRRQSGYNHAETVAKILSRELGIPCDFSLIGRKNKSYYQHEQTAKARWELARRMYYAKGGKRSLNGRTVLLCDDIITTGSTVSSCASLLKSMGASRVYAAALAGSVDIPDIEQEADSVIS